LDEKANVPDASKTAKKRGVALLSNVDFVIDSRPALSLISSNIKKVLSAQLSLILFISILTVSLYSIIAIKEDTERQLSTRCIW
jgi:hypothetical protein